MWMACEYHHSSCLVYGIKGLLYKNDLSLEYSHSVAIK